MIRRIIRSITSKKRFTTAQRANLRNKQRNARKKTPSFEQSKLNKGMKIAAERRSKISNVALCLLWEDVLGSYFQWQRHMCYACGARNHVKPIIVYLLNYIDKNAVTRELVCGHQSR
jgi:hypothetical protein